MAQLPCGTSFDVGPIGGTGTLDYLLWVRDPAGDYLVVSQHESAFTHPLRRFALTIDDTGTPTATDTGLIAPRVDPWLPSLLPVAGGTLLAFAEADDNGYTMSLSDGLTASGPATLVSSVSDVTRPLVRDPSGQLLMAGSFGGSPGTIELTESGLAKGTAITITSPTEGAHSPSFAASVTGRLAASWIDSTTACKVATLASDRSAQATQVVPGVVGCVRPRVTWLGDRFVLVHSDMSTFLFWSVWNAQLDQVSAPSALPGYGRGDIIADASGVWIVGGTSSSTIGVWRIDSTLALTRSPDIGTAVDIFSLSHNDDTTLLAWESNREMFVARLCP